MRAHRPDTAEIKSVSSASVQDEEEAALSDSTSSGDIKVRPVGSSNRQRVTADFDEPPIAPSPAPVPIQGGEDEIIRVSHVRKIKVNTREPPTLKHHKSAPVAEAKSEEPLLPQSVASNSASFGLYKKLRKKKLRKRVQDEMDDEETGSDCEPMDVIEKSPYESNADAEKGEELFTRMKSVLKERKGGDDYRTVNEEATKIFGPSNAWSLVKANALIEKSGMVYSQEWCNGNIRGNQIGKIPKELLLLCLVSKRFAKAQDLLLSGLTRDFEVSSVVNEAIQAWNLAGDYHKILSTQRNYQFASRRRDCYKCAIFVARTYGCYKAFGHQGKLEPALMAKVKACLDLMETHLPEPVVVPKKKRKPMDSASWDIPSVVDADSTCPLKRKRGRPRKHPSPAQPKDEPVDNASQDDSFLDDESDILSNGVSSGKAKSRKRYSNSSKNASMEEPDEMEMNDDDLIPYNPPVRKPAGRKCLGKINTPMNAVVTDSVGGKNPISSLNKLILKFERQHEEMGKMYQEMGQTLSELKSKVQENRTATEEEIRNELLLEVQENLLKSFGKK